MSFTRTLTRRGRLGPSVGRRSAAPRRAVRRRRRVTPRMRLALVATILLAALLFGAWTWLRDSSLVGVDRVTINGASGADAGAIRSALRSAAHNMTTLDVRMNQLRTAVAPFPEVKRLEVRTEFPHRVVIDVVEERPVALLDAGTRQIPVASDGTILRSVSVSSSLPTIPVSVPPVGRRLPAGRVASAVALLAAAPYQLLPKISQVTAVAGHGLTAQLRNGPSIYFGDTTLLAAKWIAVTAVLADPGSAGASYIDVTDPARPAAGAGAGDGTGSGTSGTSSDTSGSATSDSSSPSGTGETSGASTSSTSGGGAPETGGSGPSPGG
ncbi:MAG TPA: FtsQ-type POTRA domain-containing protein [Solirubrobacteraceae bacterium]|nr:FtsQ-type POTRA domain-containing protein [Solirubrobacteraceae bacterium]